jgi:hypothetical protein
MNLHSEFQGTHGPDPKEHIQLVEKYLTDLKSYCHSEIKNVRDPKAQALLETTAEVLGGLEKAYSDYQSENQGAWINDINRPTLM